MIITITLDMKGRTKLWKGYEYDARYNYYASESMESEYIEEARSFIKDLKRYAIVER